MPHPIDSQIQQGMQQQLQQWREALQNGAKRLGWKVGFNRECDQQAANLPSLQIGYMLAERSYQQTGHHLCINGGTLLVEGEIAIYMAQPLAANASPAEAEAAIGHYAAAIELINTDLTSGNDICSLLTSNLVHEAVVLGGHTPETLNLEQLTANLTINDQPIRTLDKSRVPDSYAALLCQVANTLAEHGEQLQAGDWVITGAATTPAPVSRGDTIQFQLGELSPLSLTIT